MSSVTVLSKAGHGVEIGWATNKSGCPTGNLYICISQQPRNPGMRIAACIGGEELQKLLDWFKNETRLQE